MKSREAEKLLTQHTATLEEIADSFELHAIILTGRKSERAKLIAAACRLSLAVLEPVEV